MPTALALVLLANKAPGRLYEVAILISESNPELPQPVVDTVLSIAQGDPPLRVWSPAISWRARQDLNLRPHA